MHQNKQTYDPNAGVRTTRLTGFCEHCPNWGKCVNCGTTNHETQTDYLKARIEQYGPQDYAPLR
jgi:hypothetical protein